MKTQMEMPLLVTRTFQKQIELMVQLNLQCKKDKPPTRNCKFIIAEACLKEKEIDRLKF